MRLGVRFRETESVINANLSDSSETLKPDFGDVQTITKGGGTCNFTTDETLSFVNNVLSVNVATEPDPDNTLPISSAAVAITVGNIDEILKTI
jgi:hypothetical protein